MTPCSVAAQGITQSMKYAQSFVLISDVWSRIGIG